MQELIDAIASLPVGSIVSGQGWDMGHIISFLAELSDKGVWHIDLSEDGDSIQVYGYHDDIADLVSRCQKTRGIPGFTVAIR